VVTNAPPPGDYTYNNYGYGNQNNGYGTPPGGPPAYSSSWNNAPNLFTNGSFGNSPYGSPPGYGGSSGPSIFAATPPGTGYPGAQEFGSFNTGYPSAAYDSGQEQSSSSSTPVDDSTITDGSTPVDDSTIADGSTPVDDSTITDGSTPVDDSTITDGSTPVDDSTIADGSTPVNDSTITDGSTLDGETSQQNCVTPPPGDTTTPPPAGTTPGSSGTGSDYVDMMMTALKKNGAGPELLDAYMKQYVALGMVPAGTAVPSGDDDSSTPGTGDTPGTPPAVVGPTPIPPTDGAPPADGPTPTPPVSGPVPSAPTGNISTSDTDQAANAESATPEHHYFGNLSDTKENLKGNKNQWAVTVPSAKNGAESPEFTNAGPINWDKAPAALQALKPQIEAASKASGTPESIVASVIWSESRGKIDVAATDGGSDAGLMQVDNDTYDKEIAGKNGLPHGNTPTNKDQNIMAGATYLNYLKGQFGSWDVALRAYNSGRFAGVDKNNPDATPANTGIPAYIQFNRAHILDLQDGTLNPDT
jgi:hypothetical protein